MVLLCSFQASAWNPKIVTSGTSTVSAGKATPTADVSNTNTATSSSTISVNINPTDSLSNKLLIVVVGWENISGTITCDSVAYDADGDAHAMIKVDDQAYEAVTYNGVSMWYLLDASIDDTEQDIVADFSTGPNGASIHAFVFYNVKQQAPEATGTSTTDTSTTPSATVTTVTNGSLVITAVSNDLSTNDATIGSGTEFPATGTSQNQHLDSGYIIDAVFGAQAIAWTIDEANWGQVITAFEAADL